MIDSNDNHNDAIYYLWSAYYVPGTNISLLI